MTNHIATWAERLVEDQNKRHAWLYAAGEKIRQMNEEEQSTRGGSEPNKPLPSNQ